jgi:hypothetical protein
MPEVTLAALEMQRICSETSLAVFAIADEVPGYIEIRQRFDSRRLRFELIGI